MKNIILIFILFLSLKHAFAIDPLANYQGTNLTNYDQVTELYQSLNLNKKNNSECYERAHVWAYQLFDSFNIYSYKAFIFFTNQYRRKFDNKWWFHVAPAVMYNNEYYVFDPEFLKEPTTLKAWKNGAIDKGVKSLSYLKSNYEKEKTNLNDELLTLNLSTRYGKRRKNYILSRLAWIQSEYERLLINEEKLISTSKENWPYNDGLKEIVDLDCPIITKYSEYKEAQETKYCYIIMSNMFVWEPDEIQLLEHQDQNKVEFSMREIFTSFKKAFKGPYPFN